VLESRDDGSFGLRWHAVSGARGYRVALARGEQGFDQGQDVETNELLLDDLTPLQTLCARVATLNEGGVGLAGPILCARPRMARTTVAPAEVLLVDGFDREDPWVQEVDNLHDATRRHAHAIAAIEAFDAAVDAVQDEALLAGDIELGPYRAVIFAFGLESQIDRSFTPELRSLVEAFHASGGAVIASGAEVGYEMWLTGDTADQDFVRNLFGADYAGDDAETYEVEATAGGLFEGLIDLSFCCADEVEHQGYDVQWPDHYTAVGTDSSAPLSYAGGEAAAVLKASPAPTALLGFPFETVVGTGTRRDLMQHLLDFATPWLPTGDLDLDSMPDEWETGHGLDPADASDADQDLDGDGVPHAAEYAAGTDPTGGTGPYPDGGGHDAPTGADAGGGGDVPPPEECGCGCCGCGEGCGCGAQGSGAPAALGLLLLILWRRRTVS